MSNQLHINSQSNLSTLRRTLNSYLKGQNQIATKESYQALCSHLCDKKIFRPQQQKQLTQYGSKIPFPISIRQFQLIIMNNFADKNSLKLLKDLKEMQLSLRQTKGVLSVWKEKGLSEKQAKQLQSIFAKGNQKMKEVCKHLNESKEIIDSISEQQIQIVSSMEQWISMQKIKKHFDDYKDYKFHNRKTIEKIYQEKRVKEVNFKKTIKNQSKVQQQQNIKIIKVIGFNSDNDQKVQITKIPKKSLDFDQIDTTLATFNAYYSLTLSQYFPYFLGYNTHCDPIYYYYYRQFFQGKTLQSIINSSEVILEEQTPIFKYWASCIFKAFRDIHLMCQYQVIMPIKLSDITVDSTGTKLKFTSIKFSQYRQLNEKREDIYECDLLYNLGKLILELLKIKQNDIQDKIKITQNKCLINALLHSAKMNQHLKNGRIAQRINFFNCQTHPLFENSQKIDFELIINNLQVISRYN